MQHNGLDSRKMSWICWGFSHISFFYYIFCHNGSMGLRVKANKMYSENRLKAERSKKAHREVFQRGMYFCLIKGSALSHKKHENRQKWTSKKIFANVCLSN